MGWILCHPANLRGHEHDHHGANLLTLTIDRLTLDCFGNSYSFSKEQISSITKFRGLFSLGIQINSDSEKMPIPLVFWSLRFACLRKNLEMRGFSID